MKKFLTGILWVVILSICGCDSDIQNSDMDSINMPILSEYISESSPEVKSSSSVVSVAEENSSTTEHEMTVTEELYSAEKHQSSWGALHVIVHYSDGHVFSRIYPEDTSQYGTSFTGVYKGTILALSDATFLYTYQEGERIFFEWNPNFISNLEIMTERIPFLDAAMLLPNGLIYGADSRFGAGIYNLDGSLSQIQLQFDYGANSHDSPELFAEEVGPDGYYAFPEEPLWEYFCAGIGYDEKNGRYLLLYGSSNMLAERPQEYGLAIFDKEGNQLRRFPLDMGNWYHTQISKGYTTPADYLTVSPDGKYAFLIATSAIPQGDGYLIDLENQSCTPAKKKDFEALVWGMGEYTIDWGWDQFFPANLISPEERERLSSLLIEYGADATRLLEKETGKELAKLESGMRFHNYLIDPADQSIYIIFESR